MKKWIVLIIILLLGTGRVANSKESDQPKRNVILDVDTSGDDLMAILFLLTQPNIDIRAITIVNGVSNVDAGAEMVLRLLSMTGHSQIPVAKGARIPMEGNNSFPAKWQPVVEKPYGLPLPVHSLKVSDLPADIMMTEMIKKYRGNVSILALGPLTNVAGVFTGHPELTKDINCIYISDGAVFVEGSIHSEYPAVNNTVSGWNLWVDATAANRVFASGVKIMLIPLDVTAVQSPHPILLKSGTAAQFKSEAENSVAGSLAILMNNWIEYYHTDTRIAGTEYQAPVWDLVAAEIFANPSICTENRDHYIIIRTGDPDKSGQIIITDEKERNVTVCLNADQALFDSLLLRSSRMDSGNNH